MEMKFHLPYLDSNLEGCVYVEKEAGAIRWLVWGQESYETLEYLSRVGNFPKVKRDGSGGPGLRAINTSRLLYGRIWNRAGWLFPPALLTIIN